MRSVRTCLNRPIRESKLRLAYITVIRQASRRLIVARTRRTEIRRCTLPPNNGDTVRIARATEPDSVRRTCVRNQFRS